MSYQVWQKRLIEEQETYSYINIGYKYSFHCLYAYYCKLYSKPLGKRHFKKLRQDIPTPGQTEQFTAVQFAVRVILNILHAGTWITESGVADEPGQFIVFSLLPLFVHQYTNTVFKGRPVKATGTALFFEFICNCKEPHLTQFINC